MTCTNERVTAAAIDVAAGTITVPVPMAVVGAKRGSTIGVGEYPVAAAPGRETNLQPLLGDYLNVFRNYEVR